MFNKISSLKKAILIGGVFLLFLVACSDSNNEEGSGSKNSDNNELNVTFAAQPTTLDNHLTTSFDTVVVTRAIYETLVTFDSDYEVQPMLAESWEESDEGKKITFKLREDVPFHNGEEMKASDVVSSMNRWLEISSEGKEKFPDSSFEEIDDYTVEFNLSEPFSLTLSTLAYDGGSKPVIMQEKDVDEAGEDDIQEYIGTGPFKFEEWKQDQHIHFSKFDEYKSIDKDSDGLSGKKDVLLQDLYFHYVSDEQTRISGLKTDQYDVVDAVPYNSVDQIENDDNIQFDTTPRQMLNIYFNKKKGLFSNKEARKAILVGIDNEAILNAAVSDYYELNHNMMMNYQKEQWDNDAGKDLYNKNDVNQAKELLEEADYDGKEISILVGTDKDYIYNGAIVLQQQLEEMGLNTKLEAYEGATISEKRDNEDAYDIYFKSDTPKPEPTSLLYLNSDFPGWTESSELDDILDETWNASSEEEAKGYYGDLQEWFYDYQPIVKIGDGNVVYAYQNNVKGLEMMDGPIFWNVEVSE